MPASAARDAGRGRSCVALIETQKPVVDIAANIPAMVFAQVSPVFLLNLVS